MNWLITNGFTIFGLEIKFYGVIIASAMLIAIFLVQYLAKKRGMNPDDIIILAVCKDVQFSKTLSPMVVNDDGISIEVIAEFANA